MGENAPLDDHDNANIKGLQYLHEDVLYLVLSYLDCKSICQLGETCRFFNVFIQHDLIWRKLWNALLCVDFCYCGKDKTERCDCHLPMKEQCRLSKNWVEGKLTEKRLVTFKQLQMPHVSMSRSRLWLSYNSDVNCYLRKANGKLKYYSAGSLKNPNLKTSDVSNFAVHKDRAVVVYRDGSLGSFSLNHGTLDDVYHSNHTSDIHGVDFTDQIVVTGSRDHTVNINSLYSKTRTMNLGDRVWTVRINPEQRSVAVGTAGIYVNQPLTIWDLETCTLLGELGPPYEVGAGVLDIIYENQHIMLSCGYDMFIRMWDVRMPWDRCVKEWEEPDDTSIYCIQSDGNNAMISGLARFGVTRLWDKRLTNPVQIYYSRTRKHGPVYSLAFDSSHLYTAMDSGLDHKDFTTYHTK